MSSQRVLLSTTTTLVSYPRVEAGEFVVGVPSTPEVRIGTAAVAMPDESGAWPTGTVDPLSTTLSAPALTGETALAVVSAAWVKGRRYLIADADDTVIVTSSKTVTGTTLYLTQPLERDVALGATVKGWAISKALTTAQAAQVGNGVAVFRAIVDGITYSWAHPFRVVRRMVVVPLTGPELTAAYPIVMSMASQSQSLDEVIRAAWDHRVLPKLAAKGVLEEDIVDAPVLTPLLSLACVVHLAAQSRAVDAVWRESLNADFDRLVETTMSRADWHDEAQVSDPPLTPDPIARRMGLKVTR